MEGGKRKEGKKRKIRVRRSRSSGGRGFFFVEKEYDTIYI